MNTTHMTEQQRYNNLDLIYSNLSFAYLNGNAEQMRYYFTKFTNEYPEYLGQMENCINCVFYENRCPHGVKDSINNVFGNTLKLNIEGCLRAIEKVLDEKSYHTFSLRAINTIYYPKQQFTLNDILYQRKHNFYPTSQVVTSTVKSTNSLTVSDLLSVADYSIKVLDTLNPSEKTQDISDTITILKSIDLALNNKPEDKPINKSLHVVNSVITSAVKRSLDKNEDKQFVSTTSLLFDLAIDFFCKR